MDWYCPDTTADGFKAIPLIPALKLTGSAFWPTKRNLSDLCIALGLEGRFHLEDEGIVAPFLTQVSRIAN